MKLFEFNARIETPEWGERYKDREAFHNFMRDMADLTSDFNGKIKPDDFICITGATKREAQFTAIICSKRDEKKLFNSYIKALCLDVSNVSTEEILLNSLNENLRRACRMEVITDEDEIIEAFKLDSLLEHRRFGPRFEWQENLIDTYTKEVTMAECKKLFTYQSLIPEVERIYNSKRLGGFVGHPVHYIVETDDRDCRRETYRNLLRALHTNHRVENRRYAFVDVDVEEGYDGKVLSCLYGSNIGGTVVLRFENDAAEENEYADTSRDIIADISRIMSSYRNKVLTVLCLPKASNKLKNIFNEHLEGISFVHIEELPAEGDRAKAYLRYLARENNIRADKKLVSAVEENVGYYGPELIDIFTKWQDKKIKNTYYPAYNDVECTKKVLQKEKAKGSAYDELMNMIGIDEAKKVINQALDFFKAKKLFSSRGMDTENGAMHMVFTGNPGTAKTTVARLFARIMRENGILSGGQLVEVGRGDLVGKFVGWTAPTIKAKFKKAKGGVLFIDEAYSLVDDRSGSFGDEAINTIVQEMENNRDDVIVIFAGYPDKMEQFIQKNPGLRSRIAFHIPFNDYSAQDLCGIARLMADKKSLKLTDDAFEKLNGIFENARTQSDFGNGRYVRNVLEKAKLAQATRLVHTDYDKITDEDILTIRAEDIEVPSIGGNTRKSIGFC